MANSLAIGSDGFYMQIKIRYILSKIRNIRKSIKETQLKFEK